MAYILPLFILILSAIFLIIFIYLQPPVAGCSSILNYETIEKAKSLNDTFYPIISKAILLIPILAIISLLLTIYLAYKTKSQKLIWTWWAIITLIIFSSLFFLLSNSTQIRGRSRDARRMADLKQIQNYLELYYTTFNHYPLLNGVENSWGELSNELINNKIINQMPNDPCKVLEREYAYGVSADGKNYVLRAFIDDQLSPALGTDLDGMVYGVNCGEQGKEIEYCVTI